MKKSFRGLLADGSLTRIRLSTNNGLTGYRINKFQLFATNPGTDTQEAVMQIYTTLTDETGAERTPSSTVTFDDPTLIAAAFYKDNSSDANPTSFIVVFDNLTFNQDIFITMVDPGAETNESCNFYLELEQVTLSKDEATVATLKDMRAGPDTNFGP